MKSNLENNFLGDVERYPLWVSFIGSVACRAGVVWRRTSAKLNHGDSAEKTHCASSLPHCFLLGGKFVNESVRKIVFKSKFHTFTDDNEISSN